MVLFIKKYYLFCNFVGHEIQKDLIQFLGVKNRRLIDSKKLKSILNFSVYKTLIDDKGEKLPTNAS